MKLDTCCKKPSSDPVRRLLCMSAMYSTKQLPTNQFLEEFPASQAEVRALWDLDDIANVEKVPVSREMFGSEGPAAWYIGRLFKLVIKNKKAAIIKYMNLYSAA